MLFYQRSRRAGQGVQVQVAPTHNGESSCDNNENEVQIHRQFSLTFQFDTSIYLIIIYIDSMHVLAILPSYSAN